MNMDGWMSLKKQIYLWTHSVLNGQLEDSLFSLAAVRQDAAQTAHLELVGNLQPQRPENVGTLR